MIRVEFEFDLVLIPLAPVLIGRSSDAVGVDKSYEVDWQGWPVIPASTVRGQLRAAVSRLVRHRGRPEPDSTGGGGSPAGGPKAWCACCPERLWTTGQARMTADSESWDESEPCVVCSLFGNTRLPSSVTCRDLVGLPRGSSGEPGDRDEFAAPYPLLRTQVAVSRHTRTAEEHRLFTAEVPSLVLSPGLTRATAALTHKGAAAIARAGRYSYVGRVSGEASEALLGLLLAGVMSLRFVGGWRSRGLGRINPEVRGLAIRRVDGAAAAKLAPAETEALVRRSLLEVTAHAR